MYAIIEAYKNSGVIIMLEKCTCQETGRIIKTGGLIQGFLRSPDDTNGILSRSVKVDSDFHNRWRKHNDGVKRRIVSR